MNTLLRLVVLLLFVAPIVQADNDAHIERLLKHPFVKADFKKERKLKILSKPFVTFGVILFKPDQGLIWKTTRPIIDTILINEDEIRQLDKEDVASRSVPMNNPIMASASSMFLTILSRDKEKILTVFDYSEEKISATKKLYKLIPKDGKLRQLVSDVKLAGQDRIEVIEINEKSGDSTTIYLSNEVFDLSRLSQEELALFERI